MRPYTQVISSDHTGEVNVNSLDQNGSINVQAKAPTQEENDKAFIESIKWHLNQRDEQFKRLFIKHILPDLNLSNVKDKPTWIKETTKESFKAFGEHMAKTLEDKLDQYLNKIKTNKIKDF